MGTSTAAETPKLRPSRPRVWIAWWWWLIVGLIVLFSAGSVFVVTYVSRRQAAIAEIDRLGAFGETRPFGPDWLRDSLPGEWQRWFDDQTSVVLNRPGVTDATLRYVGQFGSLERVWLKRTAITDAGLIHLGGLKNLTHLVLIGTDITDAGLKQLSGLDSLKYLSLDHTRITDAGLSSLTSLKRLESLGLEGTEVSDAGMGHLMSLPGLMNLAIGDTRITEQGIARLGGMPSLRFLSLDNTQLTDSAHTQLAAFPGLELLHISSRQVADLPERRIDLFDAELSMDDLADLLDSDSRRQQYFEDRGVHDHDLDRVLQEVMARGGTEAEQLLLSKLKNPDGELRGSKQHLERLEQDEGTLGSEEYDGSQSQYQVIYLTALRRLQRQPDPVSIAVAVPRPFKADTRSLPKVTVAIKSVDVERIAPCLRITPGPEVAGRDLEWSFEVRDETGALLPIRPISGGGSGTFSIDWVRYGEGLHRSLPMEEYVRIPRAGEYTVTIVYRPSVLPGLIGYIKDHEELQSLITFRSAPFTLKVDQAPKQKVSFSKTDRATAVSLVSQLPEDGFVDLLRNLHDGRAGYDRIDPASPESQLLAMGWRAVPALIEALGNAELSSHRKSWVLQLLYAITGERERDMNPLAFDEETRPDDDAIVSTKDDQMHPRQTGDARQQRLITLWQQFADEYLEFVEEDP